MDHLINENEGFERQYNNPGAIINTDKRSLENYKKKKAKEKEFQVLKKEVSDIKDMLSVIIKKLG